MDARSRHDITLSRVTLGALGTLTSMIVGCAGACPQTPIANATVALASVEREREPVRRIRAEARVEQWSGDARIRGTVYMFVERPAKVRFDAMAPLAGQTAVLTSDGARFALTDLREQRFLTGQSCPANIARLLGMHMTGEEVTAFLLGGSPRLEGEVERSIRCGGDGDYAVELTAADGRRQVLELEVVDETRAALPEAQRLLLLSSEMFAPDGETLWRVSYGDYEEVDGIWLPQNVRLVQPALDADTEVRFVSMDVNVELPEGVFQQEPRSGLEVEEVLCEP